MKKNYLWKKSMQKIKPHSHRISPPEPADYHTVSDLHVLNQIKNGDKRIEGRVNDLDIADYLTFAENMNILKDNTVKALGNNK